MIGCGNMRWRISDFALRGIIIAVLFLGGAWTIQPVHAVQPDEILKDAVLEKRARNISSELRCLVCQNQSIDDSNAPLARDLRILVRDRLKSGDSDDQVFDFVVARYGEFVLLKPPFGPSTLLLWLSPFLVLALASFVLLRSYRRRLTESGPSAAPAVELSAEELAALKRLNEEDDGLGHGEG